MSWRMEFYTAKRGDVPVREAMRALQKRDMLKLANEIDLLEEFGPQWGSQHIRKIRGVKENLWELRTRSGNLRIRTFFGVFGQQQDCIVAQFRQKDSQYTQARNRNSNEQTD